MGFLVFALYYILNFLGIYVQVVNKWSKVNIT